MEVQQGQGRLVADAAPKIGMTQNTRWRWRENYIGMSRHQLKWPEALEANN